ncbi:MAG TPA: hypothetical protein VL967_06220 [Terracidiphilus sp.]|nr:hypothetical protein [Terracidiphilus sp.]
MRQPSSGALAAIACACFVALLPAQDAKVITLRILDGKTGQAVTPSNVQVLFNHQSEAHGSWVDQKDDGTIEVKMPPDAKSIAVRATYENSIEYYINCDVARQRDTQSVSWYPVADVLASGLAIPNECANAKAAEKIKVTTKPGELVLFVRKRGWREQIE